MDNASSALFPTACTVTLKTPPSALLATAVTVVLVQLNASSTPLSIAAYNLVVPGNALHAQVSIQQSMESAIPALLLHALAVRPTIPQFVWSVSLDPTYLELLACLAYHIARLAPIPPAALSFPTAQSSSIVSIPTQSVPPLAWPAAYKTQQLAAIASQDSTSRPISAAESACLALLPRNATTAAQLLPRNASLASTKEFL